MKNKILNVLENETKIIENNIYIKNESHKDIDYKNLVCVKPWGYEFLVYKNNRIGMWYLNIKKGQSTSLHTHFNKDTFIIIIKGSAIINLIDKTINLNSMDTIFLPHYNFHGLSSFSDETYLLEIEIFNDNTHFSDKNDLLRINDQYKRKTTGYESSINTTNENLDLYKFFYLDNDFEKNIENVDFKITKLNNSNIKDNNLLEKLNKYNYNILLKGTIYDNMNFLKEGSVIKSFKNIQFPDDEILILSLYKSNYLEDSKIIYSLDQLKIIINELKENNSKIILSSGCYDIVHVGHINTLRESKKLGDKLIICLSSDEQIKILKGDTRPINNYQDRIDLFKIISYVDYIILYKEENIENEETLGTIMKLVDPDYWVKGDDYTEIDIFKKHPYLRNIKIIKNIENKSTTNIINKIINLEKK
jgi:rfaE bifunctional protein nucleotidyltransferase chain/domain